MKVPAAEIALRTDPGRDPDKQVNEDSAAHVETPVGLLAVVCDGMGGHAGGKEASELAVKTIVDVVSAATPGAEPIRDLLARALTEANTRVWSMSTAEAGLRPGSTVVCALFHEKGVHLGHVGDSRIYLVHAGAISQVTRDHSMVQELVDRNIIKAEDAAKHPDANKILRALGIAKDVEVDVRQEPLAYVAGDTFILCSDGLSDLVTPAEILEIAVADAPQQAAGRLVDLANARGGHDNITALLVRTKETASIDTAPMPAKTIPLTAHEPVAKTHPGGDTVLEAPLPHGRTAPINPTMPSAGVLPPAAPAAAVPPAAQSNPQLLEPPDIPGPPSQVPERNRTPVIVGLVLAVCLLGALAIYWVNHDAHGRRVHVPLDLDGGATTTHSGETEEDGEAPPPTVTVVPPLAPWDGGVTPYTKYFTKDGGEPGDACQRAATARTAGVPQSIQDKLDARCRAMQDGGPR